METGQGNNGATVRCVPRADIAQTAEVGSDEAISHQIITFTCLPKNWETHAIESMSLQPFL